MAEESQVDETNDGVDEEVDPPALTYDELAKALAETREEAKNRRLTNKAKDVELQRKAAEYDRIQLESLSEIDRAKKEADDLRMMLNEVKREKDQEAVAKKAGLDPFWASRIQGDTDAEMLADAKALAAQVKQAQSAGTGPLAGNRGGPVGSGSPADLGEAFRDFMMHGSEAQ